LWLAADVI
jgi:hypothetical protein